MQRKNKILTIFRFLNHTEQEYVWATIHTLEKHNKNACE